MSEMQFENTLAENKNLNNFIVHQKLNSFTNLPKKSNFDSEFIDWLSPKFYHSFTSLYDEKINSKNKAALVSLMRSDWICNEETEKKIYAYIQPHIENTLRLSEELKVKFSNTKDTEELVKLTNQIDEEVFSYVNKALFTKSNALVLDFKEKLVANCLETCNILREKKMSKDVKNVIIGSITEIFNNISLGKTQSESINKHKSNANNSLIASAVIGGILALFAIIRLLMKLT